MKTFKFKNSEVTVGTPERLSQQFEEKNMGKDSISFKENIGIRNIKEKSDKQMVQAALNKVGGNNSANVSCRMTLPFAQANEDRIVAVVRKVHAYNENMLQTIINKVPSLKAQGEEIAIQNEARRELASWAEANNIDADHLDAIMEAAGCLSKPSGGTLEADITMGTLCYELPSYRGADKHFKAKTVTFSDGREATAYVKTSESYGRKKIPFDVAYVDEFAAGIVDIATQFETAFAKVDGGNDEAVLGALEVFAENLASKTPKGYVAQIQTLSKEGKEKVVAIKNKVMSYIGG